MATKIGTVAAFLFVAFFASAQSYWDGGAALQKGDSSFESGYFAASNSFPAGTEVIVENLETGRTTSVLVSQRIDGQSDLLILLSPKAAAALGIPQGDVAPVRVTITTSPAAETGSTSEDYALSRDSDLNPAAGGPQVAAKPQEKSAQPPKKAATSAEPEEQPQGVLESLPSSAAPKAGTLGELPASAEPAVPKPAAEQPKQQAPAVPAEEAKPTDPKKLAQELASRNPQKQLYLPPREDEKFAYQAPVEPPSYAAVTPPKEQPARETASTAPEIASVNGSHAPPASPKEELALAEASLPPELNPQMEDRMSLTAPTAGQEVAAGTPPEPEQPSPQTKEEVAAVPPELSSPTPAAPKPSATQTVITLEPTAPKPPETQPAAEVAPKAAEKPPVKETPTQQPPAATKVQTIAQANYFLQLGAYVDERQARELASKLPPSYPVNVVGPATSGKQVFRILLGPLNHAESGTLLYWFRDRGFPDAFIKTAD